MSIWTKDVRIPGANLAAIDKALQSRFFQRGPGGQPLETWELEKVEVSCSPERFQRHLKLCGFVMEIIPLEWRYNRVAWPGALLFGAVARLHDLVNAWGSGVRWDETIILGGKRPLQKERETPQEAWSLLGIPMDVRPRADSFQELGVETELDMIRFLWEAYYYMPEDLRKTAIFVDAPHESRRLFASAKLFVFKRLEIDVEGTIYGLVYEGVVVIEFTLHLCFFNSVDIRSSIFVPNNRWRILFLHK